MNTKGIKDHARTRTAYRHHDHIGAHSYFTIAEIFVTTLANYEREWDDVKSGWYAFSS